MALADQSTWVIGLIILFVVGSVLNFRTSPRDNALATLREKARKMGLNPRLVPAPEWLGIAKNGQYAKMIAYYHIIIADGQLSLMRALVEGQQLKVVMGHDKYQQYPVTVQGLYGIDMQANSVGVYWDEDQDLQAEQLTALKAYMEQLANF